MIRFLVMFALVSSAALAQSRPVKLEVVGMEKSILLGNRATMTIELRDSVNQPAAAPRDMQVEVVAQLPSDKEETLGTVTVRAGQTSVPFSLPASKTEGFLYISARQPELRSGGAYLRVKQPPVRPTPSPGPVPIENRVPQNQIMIRSLPGRIRLETAVNPNIIDTVKAKAQPQPTPQPTPPPPAAPPERYQLALRFSPQRSFLGNGKDPVTVHAFVASESGGPLPEFRVNLFDGSGRLNPRPLVIPAGAEEAEATLTFDRAGEVRVEYVNSTPNVTLDGDSALSIRFDPPITGVQLDAKPPAISLVDTSNLVVTLIDDEGRPVATANPRTVSLSLESGRGELAAREVTIEPGRADAQIAFTPLWWGSVAFSAATPNLLIVPADLNVEPPYGLLGLAIVGGLVGGLVFVLRHPEAPKWRIPVGALTGTMLFWAVLFLGMGSLPRSVVLNPISIVMFAALGGWLGTELFEPLLKRIGLGGAPPEEKKEDKKTDGKTTEEGKKTEAGE